MVYEAEVKGVTMPYQYLTQASPVSYKSMDEEQIREYIRKNLQVERTLEDLVDLFYLSCEQHEVRPSFKSLEYFVSLF